MSPPGDGSLARLRVISGLGGCLNERTAGLVNRRHTSGQLESIRYLGADVTLMHATGSVLVA